MYVCKKINAISTKMSSALIETKTMVCYHILKSITKKHLLHEVVFVDIIIFL